MARVYIGRCRSYEQAEVDGAVRRALAALGGVESYVKKGQRVLLKPNLLLLKPPETAICTHPAVVQAVATLVREAGARPLIADSPGGGAMHNERSLRSLYRITGMQAVAEATGAELNLDCAGLQVPCPEGGPLDALDIMRPAAEADVIINLPKLKTHGLLRYTGAVKNLFGLVPGRTKLDYHARLPEAARFAEMLLDLSLWARPRLTIIDAIVGMEGDGPSAGRPKEMGLLIAADDCTAADLAALDIIGMDPATVLTVRAAVQRGLSSGRASDLEVLGEGLAAAHVPGFDAPSPGFADVTLERPGDPQAGDRCTGCGVCAENCPVGAITIEGQRAQTDLERCIRCYCCQELCPQHAVELR